MNTIRDPDTVAIVLAAGIGKRMQSDLAKVLHPVLGRPMLDHVLDAVARAGIQRAVVVVGHQAEQVQSAVGARPGVLFARQPQPLGTGHAVLQTKPLLAEEQGTALVLCGDTPLLRATTLQSLYAAHRDTQAAATCLTALLDDATGYGRVVRGPDGMVLRIVEEKDATPDEKAVREINSGLFAFRIPDLFSALAEVGTDNKQGEYYLTDTLEILRQKGRPIAAFRCPDPGEVLGVNTPEQLRQVETTMRQKGTMHRLWAPWRRAYVEGGSQEEGTGCFLCQFAASDQDETHGVLWRWRHWYALLNAYPYTNGHMMLVLQRHHESFVGLGSGEGEELAPALDHCEAAVREAYRPEGLNFGVNMGRVAGAGAAGHLHIHLVPRWNGDTNFMTATGETRVLPEDLESSAKRLRSAFQKRRPS